MIRQPIVLTLAELAGSVLASISTADALEQPVLPAALPKSVPAD